MPVHVGFGNHDYDVPRVWREGYGMNPVPFNVLGILDRF
jgi:hypothetical protein